MKFFVAVLLLSLVVLAPVQAQEATPTPTIPEQLISAISEWHDAQTAVDAATTARDSANSMVLNAETTLAQERATMDAVVQRIDGLLDLLRIYLGLAAPPTPDPEEPEEPATPEPTSVMPEPDPMVGTATPMPTDSP